MLRTIQHIVEAGGVHDVPTSRWVPSTVLLTTSHYRAVENAPPFEYVKSFNSFMRGFREKDEQPDPKELEWDALLEKLAIRGTDEYEEILQEYLRSGLLDVDRLKAQFAQYKKEAIHAAASAQRQDFFTAFWWDHHRSKDDLLALARALLPTVGGWTPERSPT